MNDLYILVNDEPTGPLSLDQIRQMVESGEITTEILYAADGSSSWMPLSTILKAKEVEVERFDPDAALRNFEQLLAAFEAISTFDQGNALINKGCKIIEALPDFFSSFERIIGNKQRDLVESKRKFAEQSFFKRTFGDHNSEERIESEIQSLQDKKTHIAELAQSVRDKIGTFPRSSAERDKILKEIRTHIKELKVQKKEAALTMAEVKRNARIASDGAGKSWLGLYDSSLAAAQRRGIRHAKESALRPFENRKETIARQILWFEKYSIWLEKIE